MNGEFEPQDLGLIMVVGRIFQEWWVKFVQADFEDGYRWSVCRP